MALVVQKFGGTSVGDVTKIHNVAKRIIKTKQNGNNVVVVVSAMGHQTDHLVKLAYEVSDNPKAREYDALLATGEQQSAALVAMAINSYGFDAVSLNGHQACIFTEELHLKARILDVDAKRLKKEILEGKIVIVTGFQGVNCNGDTTTIGRGGSDTSAVVLAAALNADVCEIFTDVDGVFTTDPRMLLDARKLDVISYEEMLEFASLGSGVLHPRAVECAKENNIVLHVRSSFHEGEGTIVKEVTNMERKKEVTGVAFDTNTAKIAVLGVKDEPGMAAKLFGLLATAAINVDMIIQSQEEDIRNSITFTVPETDVERAVIISKQFSEDNNAGQVIYDTKVAKISIVGVGMISTPGVAAKMFQALADNSINIELISTSEIKVSCVINEKYTKEAVAALHKIFSLDTSN
ncbi:MAG: aspartate kinase [Candidatus Margulisiibacteriota bacterium]|nr:MAG: aspartate kinase [Candidatus Margulisbacteria bacterium GWD2_39_127]OGI00942.1 MAG: aspartate kinase [Candidatus Margulisbacteria bacterium GWF2_38_17]OGI09931.1 MAG: aspartate kinase [Candidatus Margulisbacteria bacterium GWE2_39_32]PZM77230.1 MAG: aspartate kinase [Candidatus Margulisiibacteriota bacterium]HAR64236.1 aspartate kinase [Candidatus Margulisiibacteriota bacterium]